MPQTLNWISVLNEESLWTERAQMFDWLAAVLNSKDVADCELDYFKNEITCMRNVLDALHFGCPPDLKWLDERLANINLTVVREQFLPQGTAPTLPLLHARVQSSEPAALLKAIMATLLVQFADFVTRAITEDGAPAIARCEGLFRLNDNIRLSTVQSISDETELNWRKEIDVLQQHDLAHTAAIQRCGDIFIASAKAKYCSDSCRFTTFQLMKQLKNPRYHAEKQKKYRTKLSDKK
ncbi:MAG TPA: hypothetical protein V6C69_12670 [Trichormus sp.]|jgi:hypothetical protein